MWTYVPNLPSSTCAPGSGCSPKPPASPSNISDAGPALWLTLSGTAQQRPRSWRGWQRRPWIELLSATTLPPSTVSRGVDLWISSVRAFRASRTASPESGLGTSTSEATVRTGKAPSSTSSESWKSVDPPWSSSKTSQPGLWGDTSDQLERSYADWVTRSKIRSSSLRRTLALRTSGSGCLSWPTPDSQNFGNGMSAEAYANFKARHKAKGINGNGHGEILGPVTANWPSARAEDSEREGNHPNATDSLTGATNNWPTAMAQDSEQAGSDRAGLESLVAASRNWATPNVPTRGPETAESKGKRPNSGGVDLQTQAITFPSSRPDAATQTIPSIPTGGLGLLLQRWTPPECRALNPRFQWWLMGWPLLTCSELAAMEWSRWRRRVRSVLCGLMPLEDAE